MHIHSYFVFEVASDGYRISNIVCAHKPDFFFPYCRMEWKKDVSLQLAMELYPLVKSPVKLKLFGIGVRLPQQYRLATVQDVHDHRQALLKAMPSWEIANLADGSVDGASYGGHIRYSTLQCYCLLGLKMS